MFNSVGFILSLPLSSLKNGREEFSPYSSLYLFFFHSQLMLTSIMLSLAPEINTCKYQYIAKLISISGQSFYQHLLLTPSQIAYLFCKKKNEKRKIVVAIFTVCVCNDNQVTESECPFNGAYMELENSTGKKANLAVLKMYSDYNISELLGYHLIQVV